MQKYFLRIPSVALLLAISFPGIAESTLPDGYIQFPFARVAGYDFTNICKGYGDYNPGYISGVALLLFHSGVDFQAANASEYVRTPFDPAYVIDAINVPGTDEWRVIFGRSAESVSGWGYHHLNNPSGYTTGDSLFNVISPVVEHSLGHHVHIDWCIHVDSIGDNAYAQDVYNTYVNPLDYFLGMPSEYDHPGLGHVLNADAGGSNAGLRIQSIYGVDLLDTMVFGQVKFVARPVSVPENFSPSEIDSVGVRYIAHRVLKQNPATGTYGTMHWYDWRTLFSMNGFIPFLAGWDYLTLIYANSSSSDYRSEYLLNSCGVLPVDPYGDDPFENIWPVYDRTQDWADGKYCRGAFDTRLGVHSSAPESHDNSTAMIPDGRYCVELYALSHGSMQPQSWRLPVHDVDAENLLPGNPENLKGFVVDNFPPHVSSIMAYHEGVPGEPDTLYKARWELKSGGTERELDSTSFKYFSNDEDAWVGVVVEFSEPMDPDSIPEVNLYGTSLGEMVLIEQLAPCEWDSSNLGFMPEGNSFWQCYRTETGFTEYRGGPYLTVGNGCDLSGNQLDSDPSSVAVRVSSDSFVRYEPGTDESYCWGWSIYPSYNAFFPSEGYIVGGVPGFGDFRVQLDRTQCQMHYVANSPSIQGFWLSSIYPGFYGGPDYVASGEYSIQSVDHTGQTVNSYVFECRYDTLSTEEIFHYSRVWFAMMTSPRWAPLTTPSETLDDDYLWLAVNSYHFQHKEGYTPSGFRSIIPGPINIWLDVHVASSRQGITSYHDIAHTLDESLSWAGYGLGSHSYQDASIVAFFNNGGVPDTTVLMPPDGSPGEALTVVQTLNATEAVELGEEASQPLSLVLHRNPVSTEMEFSISTPETDSIKLGLFDLAGREVMRVCDSDLPAGTHSFALPVNLPGGIYLFRLRSGTGFLTEKLMVIR